MSLTIYCNFKVISYVTKATQASFQMFPRRSWTATLLADSRFCSRPPPTEKMLWQTFVGLCRKRGFHEVWHSIPPLLQGICVKCECTYLVLQLCENGTQLKHRGSFIYWANLNTHSSFLLGSVKRDLELDSETLASPFAYVSIHFHLT